MFYGFINSMVLRQSEQDFTSVIFLFSSIFAYFSSFSDSSPSLYILPSRPLYVLFILFLPLLSSFFSVFTSTTAHTIVWKGLREFENKVLIKIFGLRKREEREQW
jgi:hypothetical protein